MKIHIVVTLLGGVLDEVMPFREKDDAILEFKHQAERSSIGEKDNKENFLKEKTGLGYWTDSQSENEVHLQTHDLINPK